MFDNILKAENETHSKLAKRQVDIVPANYSFSYFGQELCDGRKYYRLGITPRRRAQYLIQGQIWIDAERASCEFRVRWQVLLPLST